jgi:arylsulfatase A-like enzyme
VFIDHTLGELFDKLDSMGEYGQTTSVWITADHGRAEDFTHHGRKSPESARVWLVAAGGAIPKLGFVDAKDTRRLSDVAPSLRVLLGLKTDDTSNAGHPLWEALPHDGEGSPMRSAALSQ